MGYFLVILLKFLALIFLSTKETNGQDFCSDCSASGFIYACTDAYHYGFCFKNTDIDITTIRKCPDGYYCSFQNFQYCTPISTSQPSCDIVTTTIPPITTDDTTTETSTDPDDSVNRPIETPINLNTYCTKQQKTGKFKDNTDSTCKTYVLCFMLTKQYYGILLYCNTDEYFNSVTAECEKERPDDC